MLNVFCCISYLYYVGLVFFVFSKTLKEQNRIVGEAYDNAGLTAQESLTAVRTLFALNGEKRVVEKYKSQLLVAEKAG